MKEVKDPVIRLFGRKIVLPEIGDGGEPSAESCGSGGGGGGGGVECDRDLESSEVVEEGGIDEKMIHGEEVLVSELCNSEEPNSGGVEESGNPTKSDSGENPKSSSNSGGMSENQVKAENGQQKALKKPDKILPCPRCNSMDTKFCYFNNYNVNQPRYFCKSCQRYWTAGGTMRNVPVGAGRRKNKTSQCHHITISDALQAARIDVYPAFKPNGTHVLTFANASCDSVASGLSLPDKRVPNEIRNRHPEIDHGDDCSIASSIITSNSSTDRSKIRAQQPGMQSMNTFPSPVPCLPALATPAIYPIPFCPAPYWTCSLPNAWNAAWPSMPSPQKPTSSPLGKHSRNGELLKPTGSSSKENSGNSIVVPKTLRIDDPEEAAKSSIWETLGIKYDSISREDLFKSLQPKGDQKNSTLSLSPALQANPAALSRSISFQEQA